MGNNVFTFSRNLHEEFSYLHGTPLLQIRRITRRLEQAHQGIGWEIDFETYVELMDMKGNVAGAADQWRLWDDNKDGENNVLEILAAMTIVSESNLQPKYNALFNLFDFHDQDYLDYSGLILLLSCSLNGLCKMTVSPPVSRSLIKHTAQVLISQLADAKDPKIPRAELAEWMLRTPAALWVLCKVHPCPRSHPPPPPHTHPTYTHNLTSYISHWFITHT